MHLKLVRLTDVDEARGEAEAKMDAVERDLSSRDTHDETLLQDQQRDYTQMMEHLMTRPLLQGTE